MRREKAAAMREWLAKGKFVVGVGARDALEAKIIEKTGFDFVWSSSLYLDPFEVEVSR